MVQNILLVYVCEMIIDIIKHSFIAKFNDIKPIAYSEFLEDLCKQVFSSDYMWILSMHYGCLRLKRYKQLEPHR